MLKIDVAQVGVGEHRLEVVEPGEPAVVGVRRVPVHERDDQRRHERQLGHDDHEDQRRQQRRPAFAHALAWRARRCGRSRASLGPPASLVVLLLTVSLLMAVAASWCVAASGRCAMTVFRGPGPSPPCADRSRGPAPAGRGSRSAGYLLLYFWPTFSAAAWPACSADVHAGLAGDGRADALGDRGAQGGELGDADELDADRRPRLDAGVLRVGVLDRVSVGSANALATFR